MNKSVTILGGDGRVTISPRPGKRVELTLQDNRLLFHKRVSATFDVQLIAKWLSQIAKGSE